MFKTKTQSSPAEIVQEKLNNGHQILPLPHVVGKLLTELKNPNASARSLAKIVESDPALTVRLLRIANSPIYGNSHVVHSVGRATTVLGFGPLRNIALTFAASKVFSGSQSSGKRKQLWMHSLGCATVARQLAKSVQSTDPDGAFLAGMFHDVGKLFFHDAIPESYFDLDDAFHGEQLIEKEAELLGATHEDVGVKLVTSWQLSEKLMIAVGFHHHPAEAIAHRDMASLIHVADAIARQGGIGSPTCAETLPSAEVVEFLGLNDAQLDNAVNQALTEFEAMKGDC